MTSVTGSGLRCHQTASMGPTTSSPTGRCVLVAVALTVLCVAMAACADGGGRTDALPATPSTPDPRPTTTVVSPDQVPAVPSPGCGSSTAVPGETKVTTTSDGAERWYYLHVPPQHDGATPLPLVLDLHGYGEGAQVHLAMSGLGAFGDEQGFVTVTPEGQGSVALWDIALDSVDLDFVGNLLDEVERTACIDLARVDVTGLSNGAFLTSAIACRWSDRIAAVAPVAGLQAIEGCDPSRPVPVIAFHGTADLYVSYDGGLGPAVATLPAPEGTGTIPMPDTSGPSIPEMTATWAVRNGCDATPSETAVAADVSLLAFDCPPGADVEMYRVANGGHSWPGSDFSSKVASVIGSTTMSISANELMWDFFEAHPLPAG